MERTTSFPRPRDIKDSFARPSLENGRRGDLSEIGKREDSSGRRLMTKDTARVKLQYKEMGQPCIMHELKSV